MCAPATWMIANISGGDEGGECGQQNLLCEWGAKLGAFLCSLSSALIVYSICLMNV